MSLSSPATLLRMHLCAAALAVPALAAAQLDTRLNIQADARLSDLGVKVFDLTPGDGAAAGYALVYNPATGFDIGNGVSTQAASNLRQSTDSQASDPLAPFAPTDLTATALNNSAHGAITATGVAASTTVRQVFDRERDPGYVYTPYSPNEETSAHARVGLLALEGGVGRPLPDSKFDFEVAPYTAVEITAVVEISGSYEVTNCASCTLVGQGAVGASAELLLVRDGADGSDTLQARVNDSLSFYTVARGQHAADSFASGPQAVRLNYANTTGSTQRLSFQASAFGYGTYSGYATGLIPEPSTYALVGLGLGAAGVVARKRRQPA